MREQFDSGEKTKFTSEDNPHDVAALFKEYFRDLPEPLLTRELYSAFLESQSKYNQGQLQNRYQKSCISNNAMICKRQHQNTAAKCYVL